MIALISILVMAIVITEAIFSFHKIENYRLDRTNFYVSIIDYHRDENPTLFIRGNRLMEWGKYSISFELLDKSNITLKRWHGEPHKKWFVETFRDKDSRMYFYEILDCPKGEHVLKLHIGKGSFSKTYYVPFEIAIKQ